MVYVTPDGKVVQQRPWSMARVVDMFWGFIAFLVLFFRTLVGLENNAGGGGRGSRGGGGSSGGGGPDGKGPKGPRIGRITTIQDCSMPGGG